MNESPKHQNKHGDHGSCQSFPQQVQAHFGLRLRLAAVTVIPATLPESAIVIRRIILCHERFYSPDRGVAVHFRASRTSAASVALRRRFFSASGRPTDREEGQTPSTKESGGKNGITIHGFIIPAKDGSPEPTKTKWNELLRETFYLCRNAIITTSVPYS